MVNHGFWTCLSFDGLALERAVEDAVFAVVVPGAIQAAVTAAADSRTQQSERQSHAHLALEQLRYEAERARRQHDAVDPAN
jgi:hypothetical protein